MTIRIRLLGRPELVGEGANGLTQPRPRGQKSWALLARIGLAEVPVPRRVLAAELFGEANDPLGALRWSLADLRRSLGRAELLRGDPLALDDTVVDLDVADLRTASDAELAGELLSGADLSDSPGFDFWLSGARAQLARSAGEELRRRALERLAVDDSRGAVRAAEIAVGLDLLDESRHELLLRALVADGRPGVAWAHLAACEGVFLREGLAVSATLRSAVTEPGRRAPSGVRASVLARSLLTAGTAALAAGVAEVGVETLRRAAEEAERADDDGLRAEILTALGSALVHTVRGFDGEGAVILHRALAAARATDRHDLAVESLRELSFIDIQAGRHGSANRYLQQARAQMASVENHALEAGILALEGMNTADQGRHEQAVELLTRAAGLAEGAGGHRQAIWSSGVAARSLLLLGRRREAQVLAGQSRSDAVAQRWYAFVPWPQALFAETLGLDGRWAEARVEAEHAFALASELGDPCWEGMAARAMSLVAEHDGDEQGAWDWIREARRLSDRVADRYAWISCHIGLSQLDLAARRQLHLVPGLADRLLIDADRADLPEFRAWALFHQAQINDPASLVRARRAAAGIDNAALQAAVRELDAG